MQLKYLTFIFVVILSVNLNAERPFVTMWEAGWNGTIVIPADTAEFSYEYNIRWYGARNNLLGADSLVTGSYTIDGVGSEKNVIIEIEGRFPRFLGEKVTGRVVKVMQWGDIPWESFERAFYNCSNMDITADDLPDLDRVGDMSFAFYNCRNLQGNTQMENWNLSNVTNLSGMFFDASSFNLDISNWDVSNVVDMSMMFLWASSFNQNIGKWDVSGVENMYGMFSHATSFNQDIGNWDVSNVEYMSEMFESASSFNQDIGAWNVSNVISTGEMFSEATSFNQDIGNWDVGNVFEMIGMFSGAVSFNQDIGRWDVSSVEYMNSMFERATSFNQGIGSWDVSKVRGMEFMFSEAEAFNRDIGAWNVSNVESMYAMFHAASSFNQGIGSWDVSKVKRMDYMFSRAVVFNQYIGGWDVSNVETMYAMFIGATSFNRDINSWDVRGVRNLERFLDNARSFNHSLEDWVFSSSSSYYTIGFDSSGINTNNYDKTLIGWAENPETPDNKWIYVFGLKYCKSADERDYLMNSKGWIIAGDEYNCDDTLAVNEPYDFSIMAFPNPVAQDLTLKAEEPIENVDIRLINMLGQTLIEDRNIDISIGNRTYDLSLFNPGLYILVIEKENKELLRQRIMVGN